MADYVLDKGYIVNTGNTVTFGTFAKLITQTNVDTATVVIVAPVTAIGVYQETLDAAKVATGKAMADVRLLGITRVIAGVNNILVGSKIINDTSGRAVIQAGAVGAGAAVLGIALQASAAVGDQIDILLTPGAVT